MKHILIDFENIQPNSFDVIDNPEECHIWLFLGVHQQKTLPYPLVKSLFRFPNTQVHMLEMQHAGKNALDHYLSFYIGKISEIDKQAEVYILARDSGYDVLVEHLNHTHEGLDVFRFTDVQSLPNVWQDTTIIHEATKQSKSLLHDKIEKDEVIDIPQVVDSLENVHSDVFTAAFINHCFKITLKQMINSSISLPKLESNFLLEMKKYALANELADYDDEQVDYLLDKVLEKFVKYELILINEDKLIYKISQMDMLNSIQTIVLRQRPQTVIMLKTTIRNCLQCLNQSTEVDEINLVIKWLKNKAVIFQNNNTILYEKPKTSNEFNELFISAKKILIEIPIIKRPKKATSLQNWFKSQLKVDDIKVTQKIVQKLIKEKVIIADENENLSYK